MRYSFAATAVAVLLLAGPAFAADEQAATGAPTPLLPPALTEPLQPMAAEPAVPAAAPESPSAPPAVVTPPPPAPPVSVPAPPASVPEPPAAAKATLVEPAPAPVMLPLWAAGIFVAAGGLVAGGIGVGLAGWHRRRDLAERRRAVAATLALELETRRQAFDAVPVPPNAEAGVSFVSTVLALANLDGGWRSAQGALYTLPEKYAAQVASHYATVHHVADFIKGQSLAAAVRMMQANRIGGYPAPDAGLMREAHVELVAAFRGVDKMVQGLRSIP
jgi:hypothetical protein